MKSDREMRAVASLKIINADGFFIMCLVSVKSYSIGSNETKFQIRQNVFDWPRINSYDKS